jgi:hypothetical protein
MSSQRACRSLAVTLREHASAAPATTDVASLQKQVRELEASLGRAAARISKLETRFAHAQAQVAWFQRVLFGQKREHVDAKLIEKQWREYRDQQEAAVRGRAPSALPEAADPMQLLMMLGPNTPSGSAALDSRRGPGPRRRHAGGHRRDGDATQRRCAAHAPSPCARSYEAPGHTAHREG